MCVRVCTVMCVHIWCVVWCWCGSSGKEGEGSWATHYSLECTDQRSACILIVSMLHWGAGVSLPPFPCLLGTPPPGSLTCCR